MKPGFGIRERIFIIIAIVVIFFYSSLSYLFNQITERDKMIGKLTENYQASLTKLEELKDKFEESQKCFTYTLLSSEKNKKVFESEFNFLHTEVIPAIGDSLILMSGEWTEEDRLVINETIRLLTDSLYFHLLDISDLKGSAGPPAMSGTEEVEYMLAESGIIFLTSEIEQNINYLLDKRRQEIASIHEEISSRTKALKKLIIITYIVSGSFIIFAIIYLLNHLRRSIKGLASNLESLAGGIIPDKIKVNEKSEFSSAARNLNSLSDYLKNLAEVARKIAAKDFTTSFKPLSEKDEPGNAILNLQESLKNADREEKKYKKEELERSWKSNGVAAINDILRTGTDNLEELGYKLVKELVQLINASAAGIFILHGDKKPVIEMLAAYAYDRKKFIEKKILPGEGLIGRCFQENETIYLTDIPEDHIKIRTGLGQSKPVSLLIVPIKLNEKVLGVIEIASLHIIEDYKINFIESIGENIATTFSNVQTNIRTSHLLEHTRQQAEEMLSQEEEMRQNMEELKATQEQFAEREEKLLGEIEELKKKE